MSGQRPNPLRCLLLVSGVTLLLAVMATELALSAREQSQTFDEGAHVFAGYRYWKNFDFGVNPEHPPLVKLVAALPLLRMPLHVPSIPDAEVRTMGYAGGRALLYSNDADLLLWRTRMAAAVFTICLALAVFLLARSMFGEGPAFLALVLLVFEPNLLAHGALVTTDVGVTLGFVLGVGAFYTYVKKPSALSLVGAGLAVGLCIAAKHSGVLIFPMLLALALVEVLLSRDPETGRFPPDIGKYVLLKAASLAAVTAISFIVLWSLYGFRYSARPPGLSLHPALSSFATRMGPLSGAIVELTARWRLLPESYLYGFASITSLRWLPTVVFGKAYPVAQWFYFPSIFIIKSTAAFVALCFLLLLSCLIYPQLFRGQFRRKGLFLAIPPAIYLAVAMCSEINYGVRHLLPIYPFLIILGSYAAWELGARNKALATLAVALVSFHVASSLRAFPNYIPYVNEMWGGSSRAYELMTDSNVDWGQGLKALKEYVDRRQIKNCRIAYYVSDLVDASYYGIPCKVLPPSFSTSNESQLVVDRAEIGSPLFVSASVLAQSSYRVDSPNPYRVLQHIAPTTLVANSILVFDGKIDLWQADSIQTDGPARPSESFK